VLDNIQADEPSLNQPWKYMQTLLAVFSPIQNAFIPDFNVTMSGSTFCTLQ
jgi:hypothetical protein